MNFDPKVIRKVARRLSLAPATVEAVLRAADEETRGPELRVQNADALARYYGLPKPTVLKLLERA